MKRVFSCLEVKLTLSLPRNLKNLAKSDSFFITLDAFLTTDHSLQLINMERKLIEICLTNS